MTSRLFQFNNDNNNNNYKRLWRQYPQKESSSVAHLVQVLGNLIVKVQCKIHQNILVQFVLANLDDILTS